MKQIKLFEAMRSIAIIALIAVIGFAFTACDDGNGGATGTAPTVTTATLDNGMMGTPYSQTLAATGDAPITWSIENGTLPTGLNLSGNTIAGTPTTAGASHFTVKASNAKGSDTKALSITVATANGVLPPAITTALLPNGVAGTAYSQTLAATGAAPITWNIESGALPTGLSLSTSGLIAGTPTGVNTSTLSTFTVKAANAVGSDTKSLSITILPTGSSLGTPPAITTASLPGGTAGTAYSHTLTATGDAPITWNHESGALPAGLTVSAAGLISGTPSAATTSTFTVKAANAAGSDSKTLSITVAPSVTIPILDRITVTGSAETVYPQGGAFSAAGLAVTAHYTDGSETAVNTGYTLSWNGQVISNGNTAITAEYGEKTITVTWEGKTTSFIITVSANYIIVTNNAQWLSAMNHVRDGGSNQDYIIDIRGDVGIAGSISTNTTFGWEANISVTLKGNGKLYLTGQGNLISLRGGQALYIDSADFTLEGLTNGVNGATQDNNVAVVYVAGTNARAELRNGTIGGNTSSSNGGGVSIGTGGSLSVTGGAVSGNTAVGSGGGVYVSGGSFTIEGGTVSGNTVNGNTAVGGGGVYVSGGNFTMEGGTVSSNTAVGSGGGVYVSESSFNMLGGTISDNTVGNGGGVYVSNGSFIMEEGIISGNTADRGGYGRGGGVCVNTSNNSGISSFTMRGGTISDNTSSGGDNESGGGGVYISSYGSSVNSTFTMEGGTISGNNSPGGGGVYLNRGRFTMKGGVISGNTYNGVYAARGAFLMEGGTISGNTGSGVYIGLWLGSDFNKTGGIIYGNDAGPVNSNISTNNGHAVFLASTGGGSRYRNTTLGEYDNLSGGTYFPTEGGWETN